MARIIKPGIRRYKELRGTCTACTCVFAVEPAEAKTQQMSGTQRGGEFRTYAHCPCCNEKVTGLVDEWVAVDYPLPEPPPVRWWHSHPEPPKPQL